MKPFASRDAAAYWGNGNVVVSVPGGYIALGGVNTPAGVELYHVGERHPRKAGEGLAEGVEGWPESVRGRYVWATPEEGGQKRVCISRESEHVES